MDKLTTSEEGDTVPFKSAFEQQGTFQQMAYVVSDLVDKRNKEVKLPAMNTSSKPKFELSQYNASIQKVHSTLPALGLSPIISHEPSTAPTLLKANLVFSLRSQKSESYTLLQKQLAASVSYQVSPMLTAVPTNIPVESIVNPPPPTFMTPIMTTSSAPGALTGLPQQPADSTDRSRKKSVAKLCLKKSIKAALQQERRSSQIGTESFLRGCIDRASARHVKERNPETINKVLKQLKTSIANQMAIYGSKSANYAHRQVFFVDGAVSPTDKGNMNSPLENKVRNLTQIVTKLADVMLSTYQRNRGLADQHNLGPSNPYSREDHQINGISPDQYTR
ncbi:unnamed protein product [Mytilus coruscus]|uniref:Uncharacterized protein n=1 Tax=Mytilus coruscus TaxID=42192 RepID=A0A6J8APX9_MYTCO|nr:unnamed protein product [Mytilus coruscus]